MYTIPYTIFHKQCTFLLVILPGGECDVTLQDVLVFFTGSSAIPPLGFPVIASLNFNDENPYPSASTCSISLTLPTKYSAFSDFKQKFVFAMTGHGGFGLY